MPSNASSDESTLPNSTTYFPAGLLNWAGHRGGGVRRLFDDKSGRPGGAVIETNLVARLHQWAASFASESSQTPRVVMLVGGPGNGKTEAVEATLLKLDEALGCYGRLISELAAAFHPEEGHAVPRCVSIEVGDISTRKLRLDVVQDASVGSDGLPPARLLVADCIGGSGEDGGPGA